MADRAPLTRRVAIPIFGEEVAPRFRFATTLLVAELQQGQVTARRILALGDLGWRARLCLLARLRIDLLACDGFDRRYLPFAEHLGLRVSWGHNGSAERLLETIGRGAIGVKTMVGTVTLERTTGAPARVGRRRRRRGARCRDGARAPTESEKHGPGHPGEGPRGGTR